MKRFFRTLCALIAGALTLTSCLGSDDDDDTTIYKDTAITQFSLGSLNRYTHTTSTATGNDTVVKSTISGSSYSMTIDHLQRRIYNTTELPLGTDIKHVVCTVSTKNGGVVAVKSATSDTINWFSSTDSIDFSQPRVFYVYSIDGSYHREYTVELNVSTQTGLGFGWTMITTISDDSLAWKRLVTTADSIRLATADSIVGDTGREQYMLSAADSLLKFSRNGGLSWQTDLIDDAASLLPAVGQAAIVSWPYATAASTDYVLLIGTPRQPSVNTMRVWRKLSPHNGGGRWVFMPFDDNNYNPLPRQNHICIAYIDNTVLAVGSDGIIRQSLDQGISWRESSTYTLPSELTGAVHSMTTDTQGRLWLITETGELWMGNLSK